MEKFLFFSSWYKTSFYEKIPTTTSPLDVFDDNLVSSHLDRDRTSKVWLSGAQLPKEEKALCLVAEALAGAEVTLARSHCAKRA